MRRTQRRLKGLAAGLGLGVCLACGGLVPSSSEDLSGEVRYASATLTCGIPIEDRAPGVHEALVQVVEAAQQASDEVLLEQVCGEDASRMEVSVALEQLGIRALREGALERGRSLLEEAADGYANPTAMGHLAGLISGAVDHEVEVEADFMLGFRYFTEASVVIDFVRHTYGDEAGDSLVAPIEEGLRAVLDASPIMDSPPFSGNEALARYQAFYPD